MKEYSVTKYKGFTLQPIVKLSDKKIDNEENCYEYSIEGWLENRSCIVKGPGVYATPEGAATAAISFAKHEIDAHLVKYNKSFFYRLFCSVGFCPASKYS